MLAEASGIVPDSLKFDADRHFFERGLDEVDVVVHGRHSHERQPHSPLRRRLILTRRISGTEVDPANGRALLWNPAHVTFDEALAALGTPNDRIGIVGGPEVFGMFLDRYDCFHLSRAPRVLLPGGRPVFPEVPRRSPEEVLSAAGLVADPPVWLDPGKALAVVSWWRRTANRA